MSKVGFVSLGCPKNLVDSEVMMGKLKQAGYEITSNPEEAETIVVNTCGFIEAAKQESIDTILEVAELKHSGKTRRIVVAGCLVERYRDELKKELPEVDFFLGTNEIEEIVEAVSDVRNPLQSSIVGSNTSYIYSFDTPRLRATPPYMAYVKIAEGCDRPCSFCAIPLMRGSFRSRSFDSVLCEVESLAEQGVKEVVLIAQDSSRYGEDWGEKEGLAKLIRAIGKIDTIEWIRILYTYPTHISDEFLDVIADTQKATKYLDLPLQHASQKILRLMRRGGNRRSLEKLIERVRRRIPNITIRTTFIVGFPGETEEDFEELISFVRNCEFDNVGVFTYSDEEGTFAFELPDKVDARTAKRRRAELMKEQAKISKQKNKQKIGQTFRVLFEGVSPESDLLFCGRHEGQMRDIDGYILINRFPEDLKPKIGEFYNVRITRAMEYDLVGEII
ncbi:MAG: 30S ribosomal protein S12 methylthiotransferase RimO [Pyrinomonadaceae bacterium]|nr:30S ribosomal protein S12 methylthiotransferase RimO [Pyrinomonadaceae bacterium]MCX7640139.1 30S ribosomal protein S12 methylthiotransferase RimO [Pyrinomonadaceae bacterium]MDW8303273.1 30S ribosomal protein S12 methylthiotransferase RimO [Acidobacteriota bacterium]